MGLFNNSFLPTHDVFKTFQTEKNKQAWLQVSAVLLQNPAFRVQSGKSILYGFYIGLYFSMKPFDIWALNFFF